MTPSLRVLLVDESQADRELVAQRLRWEIPGVTIEEVGDAAAFTQALDREFDLVITEWLLPWIDGLGVLRAVKARAPERPVIFFSGSGTEEAVVAAMRAGAADYLPKSPRHLARLATAVRQAGTGGARPRSDPWPDRTPVGLGAPDLSRFPAEAPEPVLTVSRDGVILWANKASADLLREWKTDVGAAVPPSWRSVAAEVLAGGTRRTLESPCGDRFYAFTLAPVREAGHVLLYAKDCTARRQLEEALQESQRSLTMFLSHLPGMLYRGHHDAERTLEFVSDGCRRLTGYLPAELTAQIPYGRLIAPPDRDRVQEEIRRAVEAEQPFQLAYRLRTSAGEERWVWEQGALAPGRPGERRLEGLVLDLRSFATAQAVAGEGDEDEQAETGITETRRRPGPSPALVSRLASGLAHELNNPLAALIGHAQFLLLTQPEEKVTRRAEIIVHEADRMARVIRDLVNFARPRSLAREPVAVNALIETSLASRAPELGDRKIRLTVALAPELPLVPADPDQLQQVLAQLIQSAEHVLASRGGGEIKITSDADPEKGRVRIALADDGPPIPPALLERAFDPFVAPREGGEEPSLGLALCRAIVQEHDGEIRVLNRSEGGVRFEVELPAHSTPAGAAVPRMRVLVVDDQESITQFVAGALRLDGHEVDVALGGRAGMERIRSREYDLVLMDLKMPEVGGPELHAEILRRTPRPQATIMTGDRLDEKAEEFLARTGLPVLEKPFTIQAVREYVRRLARSVDRPADAASSPA
ncbi:MAG TPA: response regulator [Candidatus Sulfotelmatobacter sp.]|nr:response regulator [Candidatus Sulfotelmatobacter sp.]